MSANDFGFSYLGPDDVSHPFNVTRFIIQQMLSRVRTSIPVQVVSCTNNGGVAPFGFVTVQPLVCMLDGNGNAIPHKNLFHLCYFRLQGGPSAVILDPVPGDIGQAVLCDRDISSVKVNATSLYARAPGPTNTVLPGTQRMHNMQDGVYYGGDLNAAPTQYIQFLQNAGGITITTPAAVTVNAGTTVTVNAQQNITVNTPQDLVIAAANATLDASGNLKVSGNVTWDKDGTATTARTHIHNQDPDTHGDGEQPTHAPTPGS